MYAALPQARPGTMAIIKTMKNKQRADRQLMTDKRGAMRAVPNTKRQPDTSGWASAYPNHYPEPTFPHCGTTGTTVGPEYDHFMKKCEGVLAAKR